MPDSANRWVAVALALAVAGTACRTTPAPRMNAQEPGAQDPGDSLEAVKRQFVGHYELVKYQMFRRDGTAVDLDYVGRIMYDEHGNMSAQGMPRSLPTRAREEGARQQGGFAYFGSVSFDLDKGIVVHHVEGSPTRGSWVGVDNVRYFEFKDGLLHLSLKDSTGRVTGTLSWRKFGDR